MSEKRPGVTTVIAGLGWNKEPLIIKHNPELQREAEAQAPDYLPG